jgi:phosphate transport system substrate-binding protein
MCASNGVYDVVEMKLGYQVAVLARARVASAFPLAGRTVFLALSETIPPLDVKNTTEFWPLPKPRDLHDRRIQILGPGQASPIGIALGSLLLEHGCRTYRPGKTRFLQNRFIPDARCTELRQDAAYEATSDNGLLTERDTRRLIADPALVGLYDYRSFLAAGKQLMAADIDGIPPEPETFANGEYPASRTFYLYIKKSHVTRLPGMREFLALYLEEIALGRDWPGFVPLAANDLAKVHEIVTELQTLPLPP